MTYDIVYLGCVVDGDYDTFSDAEEARRVLCEDVMANKLPGYLGADDFENYFDCKAQHVIIERRP